MTSLFSLPYDMGLECKVENSLALVAKKRDHFRIFLSVGNELAVPYRYFLRLLSTDWPRKDLDYVLGNTGPWLASIGDSWDNDK